MAEIESIYAQSHEENSRLKKSFEELDQEMKIMKDILMQFD
jgi:hypothetical protein